MSTAKDVASIVPGVMALGLLAEATKAIPTEKDLGKGKVSPKKLVKLGVTALVAVPLIGVVSKQVSALP